MKPTKLKRLLLCMTLWIGSHTNATVIEFEPQSSPLPNGISCEITSLKDSELSRGEVEMVWQGVVIKFTNESDSWILISDLKNEEITYTLLTKTGKRIQKLKDEEISFIRTGNTIAIAPNSTVAQFARIKKLENDLRDECSEANLHIQLSFLLENEADDRIQKKLKGAHEMGAYLVKGTISGPFLFSSFE